jgi:hypothetical protein
MNKIFSLAIITVLILSIIFLYFVGNIKDNTTNTTNTTNTANELVEIISEDFSEVYAGGFVNDNGDLVICIKEGYNSEVSRYLEENRISFQVVNYNLQELKIVLDFVNENFDSYNLVASAIDFEENKIMVTLITDSQIDSALTKYIEDEILYVVFIDNIPTTT